MARIDLTGVTFDPPHIKKVIYLDQFVISKMAKAIDVQSPAHQRVEPIWRRLFEALERVCKLQLTICPSSHFHEEESLLAPNFDELHRMYEHLSHGVRFRRPAEIEQRHTDTALVAWLDGREPQYDCDPAHITSGGLHAFWGRVIVGVTTDHLAQRVPAMRQRRWNNAQEFRDWFERCAARADKTFEYALAIESDGCRDGLLVPFLEHLRRSRIEWSSVPLGLPDGLLDNVIASSASLAVRCILEVLRRRDRDLDRAVERMIEFLNSAQFRNTPTNHISTRLFAAVARAAATGQKQPPDEGMSTDIGAVSAYLPFCDAMLIDNGTHGLIKKVPRREALDYPCRVFSTNTLDQFLTYLEQIETEADPWTLSLVRDFYGEERLEPFLTMYDRARNSGTRTSRIGRG